MALEIVEAAMNRLPDLRRRLGKTVEKTAETVQSAIAPAFAAIEGPARISARTFVRAFALDRRARFSAILLGLFAVCALAGLLTGVVRAEQSESLQAPSGLHWLGTDVAGHDVLRALFAGIFPTLVLALVVTLVAGTFGAAVGTLAGFVGGGFDAVVVRTIELLGAPSALLIVGIVQATGVFEVEPSLAITLCIVRWPAVAVVVRADAHKLLASDFITAATALGASPSRILTRHLLPSVLGPALVVSAQGAAAVIGLEVAMAALSLGATHPFAWGALIAQGTKNPGAWWLFAFPGIFTAATLTASLLIAEAMRDALDPKG